MASDADRLAEALPWIHYVPTGLLQMGVAMFLLWQLIGPALLAVSRTIVAGIWVAFFQECQQSSCGQGLLAMVAMMPVSYLTASTLSRFYKSVMALRDSRVAKINEFLAAISLVKSNAWEDVFVRSIREQRKLELVSLLKYMVTMMMSGIAWQIVPILVSVSAFSTFVLAGNVLSPEIAFTSLALFDIMMEPAQEFGWALNDLVLIWASLKRVGRFLTTQDLDDSVVKQLPGSVSGNSRVAVRLCFGGTGSFCWGKAPPPDKESKEMRRLLKHLKKAHDSAALSEQRYNEAEQAIIGDGSASREGKAAFTLTCHSDEIAIPPGGMLAVVGAVGAGKTSL